MWYNTEVFVYYFQQKFLSKTFHFSIYELGCRCTMTILRINISRAVFIFVKCVCDFVSNPYFRFQSKSRILCGHWYEFRWRGYFLLDFGSHRKFNSVHPYCWLQRRGTVIPLQERIAGANELQAQCNDLQLPWITCNHQAMTCNYLQSPCKLQWPNSPTNQLTPNLFALLLSSISMPDNESFWLIN